MGFDPRGINRTSPQVACFESMNDFNFLGANTVLEQGFTVRSSNLSDPAIEAQLVEQSRQFLALKKSQAMLCEKNMAPTTRMSRLLHRMRFSLLPLYHTARGVGLRLSLFTLFPARRFVVLPLHYEVTSVLLHGGVS
ncbi:hypothetical protein GGX14DRAFT_603742 [Mycena pura]|uniref:Uncharacterized protein n=1 Tax=Mycena pura TaxID=153505 RepID=A0AAD6UME3_9AGAR|nr:hypothetical protein GGX14DRAFT_603742 [Mycena pura]